MTRNKSALSTSWEAYNDLSSSWINGKTKDYMENWLTLEALAHAVRVKTAEFFQRDLIVGYLDLNGKVIASKLNSFL